MMRMSNRDSAEVQQLLRLMARKVRGCREKLTGQAISNSFYGLQGMSPDQAVSELLLELATKARGTLLPLHRSRPC